MYIERELEPARQTRIFSLVWPIAVELVTNTYQNINLEELPTQQSGNLPNSKFALFSCIWSRCTQQLHWLPIRLCPVDIWPVLKDPLAIDSHLYLISGRYPLFKWGLPYCCSDIINIKWKNIHQLCEFYVDMSILTPWSLVSSELWIKHSTIRTH